jgi:hypothetical protein
MRRNFDGTTADRGAGVPRFENRETWGTPVSFAADKGSSDG